MCDPDAAANERCPYRVGEGQGELDYDTIQVKGNSVYWGDNASVRQGNVAAAVAGSVGDYLLPGTFNGTAVTGFAAGAQYAYFGEPGGDLVCSQDPSTHCVLMLPADTSCGPPGFICGNGFCGNAVYGCPDSSPANQTCVTLGSSRRARPRHSTAARHPAPSSSLVPSPRPFVRARRNQRLLDHEPLRHQLHRGFAAVADTWSRNARRPASEADTDLPMGREREPAEELVTKTPGLGQ
jgi:hypothetical protein